VQAAISLVFDKIEGNSEALDQALLWFHEQSLELPDEAEQWPHGFGGDRATATLHRMVENPVYGGAYAVWLKRPAAMGYVEKEPRREGGRRKAGAARLALPQAWHSRRLCQLGRGFEANPHDGLE